MNLYTTNETVRRAGKRKNYSWALTSLSMAMQFFKMYFVKGGFRDGRAGFTYAAYAGIYKFFTLTKLWEKEAREESR